MNDAYYNMDPATRAAIEDNRIDQEERDYRKKCELLEKFQNGWDRYNKEPLFRNIIEATMRGADAWEIIDKLLEMNLKLSEDRKRLLMNGSFPPNFNLY